MQTFKVNFYGDTGTRSAATVIFHRSAQKAAREALRWATAEGGPMADRRAEGTLAIRDGKGEVVFRRRAGI